MSREKKVFRRFAGNKPLGVIRAQCVAQGVEFDNTQFKLGSDYICLRSPGARVLFNTFNGTFFGTTPDGTKFTSSDKRDGTPWFDALLDFFYEPKSA
jgi:hypothetical protein